LLTAAQLGAQAVEIDARTELRPEEMSETGVRHVRKMLDDHNLRVSAVRFRTRFGYQTADMLERRIDGTKDALKLAYGLGTSVVINHVGQIPPESDTAKWNMLCESLAELGRYGHRVGALLAAETGPDSAEEMARLIEALPAGSLGIDFHPAQLVLHSQSPADMLAKVGKHVLHVHVADATRDVALRRGFEVPLGRGSVDWPDLLGRLEEHEYRGWFTLQRRDTQKPIEELADGVKFLKQM
jgi:sugar phosphate isomerase/epimerase